MARQITLQLLADSSKFESGMKNAARAADAGAEKIEGAAKKADRMGSALDTAGGAADASESKFMGTADILDGLGGAFGLPTEGATNMMRSFSDLTGGFAAVQPMITGVLTKLGLMTAATTASTGATTAATTAQRGLNMTLLANPIGIVIAAIAALVAIFVVAYKNCETFRNIVDGAFDAVKNVVMGVFNWVKDHWPLLLAILTGPIGLAVLGISKHWDTIKDGFTAVKEWIAETIGKIVGFFSGLPGRLATAASGLWDFFYNGFKEAYNMIARFIRGLDFTIDVPDILPGPDKYTIGFPDLPLLRAKGGPVWPGGSFMVGERGPELFVPQTAGTIVPNGGGATINISVSSLDPAGAASAVMRAIEEYESRNGAQFARAAA